MTEMSDELYGKIVSKREFSDLPRDDVELAFSKFEKRDVSSLERVRLTRELLHKVFGAFGSRKLSSTKQRDSEWFLQKHLSTRERLGFYDELYERVLKSLGRKIGVVDLGAGINGLSYPFFARAGVDADYLGVEAVGQMVDLMNGFFKKEKLKGKAVHASLFDSKKIVSLLKKLKKPRVVFLFKVVDSLEMLEKDYSKKLLLELGNVSERIVLSFATRSMVSRRAFKANRSWIFDFVRENFNVEDEFDLGAEKYLVFCKR